MIFFGGKTQRFREISSNNHLYDTRDKKNYKVVCKASTATNKQYAASQPRGGIHFIDESGQQPVVHFACFVPLGSMMIVAQLPSRSKTLLAKRCTSALVSDLIASR